MKMKHVGALMTMTLASSALPAQNLLRWDAWKLVRPDLLRDVRIDARSIYFKPYSPTSPEFAGVEQPVTVPTAGFYELNLQGWAGTTGYQDTRWSIGPASGNVFDRGDCQSWDYSWPLWLPAGAHVLRILAQTSNMLVDPWQVRQPVLRPIVGPAIRSRWCTVVWTRLDIDVAAHVLMASPRLLLEPARIPGFSHVLELDPVGLVFVATGPGTIQVNAFGKPSLLPRLFWLQAIRLLPDRAFGSATFIQGAF